MRSSLLLSISPISLLFLLFHFANSVILVVEKQDSPASNSEHYEFYIPREAIHEGRWREMLLEKERREEMDGGAARDSKQLLGAR